MPASLKDIDRDLRELLDSTEISDYCPNGLQVSGRSEVEKLVTGVTASQPLIEAAIAARADVILVHHGYFWRGEDQRITGIKRSRIKALLEHDLNLLAYHLPLDIHPEFGNNAQLAKLLNFRITGSFGKQYGIDIGLLGETSNPCTPQELGQLLEQHLGRQPLVIQGGPGSESMITKVAWCTGAAQGFFDQAIDAGAHAYITGEISEPTVHLARESGVHFFAAGHHATERYGVQAVGNYLAAKFSLEHSFIDIDNPI